MCGARPRPLDEQEDTLGGKQTHHGQKHQIVLSVRNGHDEDSSEESSQSAQKHEFPVLAPSAAEEPIESCARSQRDRRSETGQLVLITLRSCSGTTCFQPALRRKLFAMNSAPP